MLSPRGAFTCSLTGPHSPRTLRAALAKYGAQMALELLPEKLVLRGDAGGGSSPIPPSMPKTPRAGRVHRQGRAGVNTWLLACQSAIMEGGREWRLSHRAWRRADLSAQA